jgi:hypothetical protein
MTLSVTQQLAVVCYGPIFLWIRKRRAQAAAAAGGYAPVGTEMSVITSPPRRESLSSAPDVDSPMSVDGPDGEHSVGYTMTPKENTPSGKDVTFTWMQLVQMLAPIGMQSPYLLLFFIFLFNFFYYYYCLRCRVFARLDVPTLASPPLMSMMLSHLLRINSRVNWFDHNHLQLVVTPHSRLFSQHDQGVHPHLDVPGVPLFV